MSIPAQSSSPGDLDVKAPTGGCSLRKCLLFLITLIAELLLLAPHWSPDVRANAQTLSEKARWCPGFGIALVSLHVVVSTISLMLWFWLMSWGDQARTVWPRLLCVRARRYM